MYELGVAHALGKPTVMIAQSVSKVPFDVRAYPVHEYSTHFARAGDLIRGLRELGSKHRAGELLFANPVTDFVPEIAERTPTITSIADYSIDDVLSDLAGATARIARFGESFTASSKRFATRMSAILPTLTSDARSREAGMNNTADTIRELGTAVRAMATSLHEAWELYGRATAWLLAPEQLSQIHLEYRGSFAQTAQSIDDTMNGIIAGIANLRAANDQTPRETGNLTHAVETTHDALTRLLNEIMTGKAHLARAIDGFAQA